MKPSVLALLIGLALVAAATTCGAQVLPAGPVRALDGDLLVSGEASATFGSDDSSTYFDTTDYEHNLLRLFRVSVAAAWRPLRRLAFVGELRSEDLERPRAYAAYVRVRPWASRELDVQVGRIPQIFGAFSRRAYLSDNPVIGYPLAYHYLTSLRPDAVPATAGDLVDMRARGWRTSFPVGNLEPGPGVPLVTALRWDTGVQARWKVGTIEASAAVTAGTLSDPRLSDNNRSPQLAGRIVAQPLAGLVLGASGSRGAWLASRVVRQLPSDNARRRYPQTALGADVEYSRDRWLLRSETIWSRWSVPFATSAPRGVNLDALALWVDGRYRLTPRVTLGGRADHLGFSSIAHPSGALAWDAPVTRLEASASYALQRNLVSRVNVQRNQREAGRIRRRTYYSTQLLYWF